MELVVVLAILIALAAILVPLFPSMIERAHKASESTNTSELTKAVQLYNALYGVYPDGFDSLLNAGGTMENWLPANPGGPSPFVTGDSSTPTAGTNYLGATASPVGGYIHPGPVDKIVGTLNIAGINTVYPLATGGAAGYTGTIGWTPTFNPYPSDTPATDKIPLKKGGSVMFVSGSGMLRTNIGNPSIINLGSSTQFVVFGVGKRTAMNGTTLASIPSLFPDDAVNENPANVYERFGAVFQVEDLNGNALPSALFVSAVSIESDGLEGDDKDLEGYYQRIQQVGQNTAP